MAHNTKVTADTNAPPITRILAEFVARHPAGKFPPQVEQEAHRTFMNWLGLPPLKSWHRRSKRPSSGAASA